MTDNREIPDLALRALAAFIAELRKDWQAPGILAALRAERESDPWQLAQRMLRRAADPSNTSPRLQAFDAPLLLGCRRHPGAAVRTDGTCGVCFSEAHADEASSIRDRGGHPIPVEARRLFDAALRREKAMKG